LPCSKFVHRPGSHGNKLPSSIIIHTIVLTSGALAGLLRNSLRRSSSFRFRIAQQNGNQHVRWERLWRRYEDSGSVHQNRQKGDYAGTPDRNGVWDELVWNTAGEAVADHQDSRCASLVRPPSEFGDPNTLRMEKWPIEQGIPYPRSRRSIAGENEAIYKCSCSVFPLDSPGESLHTSPRITLLQPVTDNSFPGVFEYVDHVMTPCILSPVKEHKLKTKLQISRILRFLNFSKFPGPNGIPNRTLMKFSKRTLSFMTYIFNVALFTHHFPQVLKQARVISIVKPGKDPVPPTFHHPFSILDKIGKFIEKSQ